MLNASIGRYIRSDEATLFAIVGFGGLGVLRSDQDVATRKHSSPPATTAIIDRARRPKPASRSPKGIEGIRSL
jgi:hypothetical protein